MRPQPLKELRGRKTDARQDHFPMHISLGPCNPSLHFLYLISERERIFQYIPPSDNTPLQAKKARKLKNKIFLFSTMQSTMGISMRIFIVFSFSTIEAGFSQNSFSSRELLQCLVDNPHMKAQKMNLL